LYNGKELQTDFDLEWYDYGARMYDASITIFSTTDPKAMEYHSQSPYVYATNNPIKFVDENGEGILEVIIGKLQNAGFMNGRTFTNGSKRVSVNRSQNKRDTDGTLIQWFDMWATGNPNVNSKWVDYVENTTIKYSATFSNESVTVGDKVHEINNVTLSREVTKTTVELDKYGTISTVYQSKQIISMTFAAEVDEDGNVSLGRFIDGSLEVEDEKEVENEEIDKSKGLRGFTDESQEFNRRRRDELSADDVSYDWQDGNQRFIEGNYQQEESQNSITP